ncbi:MAG: ABC-ATPase domain-containing protein [Myxococcota bacterium]|nr:ABC-ATPase domain-containing protein [Myxococcota bacterium]
MKSDQALIKLLWSLDGAGYPQYKKLKGTYGYPHFSLDVEHVQGDPFAEPSIIRVVCESSYLDLPAWVFSTVDRRRAAADFFGRAFAYEARGLSRSIGSGKGGKIVFPPLSQHVLWRNFCHLATDGTFSIRFRLGLPARGRRILGREAGRLFEETLPALIEGTFAPSSYDESKLKNHCDVVEDSVALRTQLSGRDLIAFAANGSLLPRRSGIDDRPMSEKLARAFVAPDELSMSFTLPNVGVVTGMGICRGVNLIVGGGYHGKSTLLQAIEVGCYDSIPGDGREYVVASETITKIRAEDGRYVENTDISNFINNLPAKVDTSQFDTENASGSTSQAASVVEALEVGSKVLVFDEDTSATNFMIRDLRMRSLIAKADEPITPLIDHARNLIDELGVSIIAVIGGCGDYLDVADAVIGMMNYLPVDLSGQTQRILEEYPRDVLSDRVTWKVLRERALSFERKIDFRDRKGTKISVQHLSTARLGRSDIDVRAVEQLVEQGQLRAILSVLCEVIGCEKEKEILSEVLINRVYAYLEHQVGDEYPSLLTGDHSSFRIQEFWSVVNRIRARFG